MDDLDRLYVEFVELLRRERPEALTEAFTVSELHDRLIPYRRIRDSADLRSNDDYEAALSRLLAGERGYLLSDGRMQEEVRAGLDETLPDIRRYRAFPDVRVRLNPKEIPPPGDIRFAPPELREQADWTAPRSAEPEPETPDEFAEEALTDADAADEGSYEADVAEKADTSFELDEELPAAHEFAPETAEIAESETGVESIVPESPPEVEAPGLLEFCPQCGADVPEEASFCPFCGCRLSPETCRSCGAEVERGWRFCAACGSSKEGADVGPA